jgi:hypothetical protein
VKSALRVVLTLVTVTAIYAIGLSTLALHGYAARPEAAALLWTFAFRTLLAIWVRIDRRRRNVSLPFEFEAFVFFGWPVAIPYYLYRTRGRRGLLVSMAFYGLRVAPSMISSIIGIAIRLR